ncbi:putative holin-like toxin [Clostridium sp. YIM B02569]
MINDTLILLFQSGLFLISLLTLVVILIEKT